MIRLHFVVEGQTEEEFVNSVLADHLGQFNISSDARCVETSRRKPRHYRGTTTPQRIFRGGISDYARARKDIELWMKEDQKANARFTTMFDLYMLPDDFPGCLPAPTDPYLGIESIENAFAQDLVDSRFIPYIQLHEFEALILAEPERLASAFLEHDAPIQALVDLAARYPSPELIDDGVETAPLKRTIRVIGKHTCIYATGSGGREELSVHSDLDAWFPNQMPPRIDARCRAPLTPQNSADPLFSTPQTHGTQGSFDQPKTRWSP